jgi:hypothetical protein
MAIKRSADRQTLARQRSPDLLERELFDSTRERWIASEESPRNSGAVCEAPSKGAPGFPQFDSEDRGDTDPSVTYCFWRD